MTMSTELREVKQRISGTRQIRKVSNALQMIASAQLQQVRLDIGHSNLYTERLRSLLQRFEKVLGEDHPLLTRNKAEARTLIVFGAERGLCGGFNSELSGEAVRFVRQNNTTKLVVVGGAVRRCIERAGLPVTSYYQQPKKDGWGSLVSEVVSDSADSFRSGKSAEIWVLYCRFVSAWVQEPCVERVLPIPTLQCEPGQSVNGTLAHGTVEPSAKAVTAWVIEEWLHRSIYNAFLNSIGSEAAARQAAMARASENAEGIIDELTMLYRRLRQDSITMEMLDLSGGAMV